jgi:hypothetical protein
MRAALLALITSAAPCIARAQSLDVASSPRRAPNAAVVSEGSYATHSVPRRRHFYPARRAYHGGPIPSDMTVVRSRRLTAMTGGVAIMSLAYGGVFIGRSILCLTFPCTEASMWLYAPIVGPFVYAAQAPNFGAGALAVLDGLAQSVGTLLIVVGITTFREDLVPIPLESSRAHERRLARTSWQLVPSVGPTSTGLAMHLAW